MKNGIRFCGGRMRVSGDILNLKNKKYITFVRNQNKILGMKLERIICKSFLSEISKYMWVMRLVIKMFRQIKHNLKFKKRKEKKI